MKEKLMKRPVTVLMIMLIMLIFGMKSLPEIKRELLPEIHESVISVLTLYPGASIELVKNGITKKIEESMSAVPGVENIYSESVNGASLIELSLNDAVSEENISAKVREKIDKIQNTLPTGCSRPLVLMRSSNETSFMEIVIAAPGKEADFLYNKCSLLNKFAVSKISRISGIASVKKYGFKEKAILIKLDLLKMTAYGLEYMKVYEEIYNRGFDIPVGYIETERDRLEINIQNKFTSLEDIKNIVLFSKEGRKVSLKDIATVKAGFSDSYNTVINEKGNVLLVKLIKKKNADSIEVAENVNAVLNQIRNQFPEFKFIVYKDNSKTIKDSIFSLLLSIGTACLFVAIIIRLYTGNLQRSMAIMLLIPCSLTVTFFVMYIFNVSFNIISLCGISLSIGILIDNGIIISEVWSKSTEKSIRNISTVSASLRSSSCTTLIVFLPLLIVNSSISGIFKDLGIVVSSGVISSYLISVYLQPVILGLLLKNELSGNNSKINMYKEYEKIISKFLKFKKNKNIIISVVFIVSLLIIVFSFPETNFLPEEKCNAFKVVVSFRKNISHSALVTKTKNIVQDLNELNIKKQFYVNIGMNGNESVDFFSEDIKPYSSVFYFKADDKKIRNDVINYFENRNYDYKYKLLSPLKEMQNGFLQNNSYYYEGDQNALIRDKENIKNKFSVIIKENTEPISFNKLKITDYIKAAAGLEIAEVSSFLKLLTSGDYCGTYLLENEEVPVKICSKRKNSDFENIYLVKNGYSILLKNIFNGKENISIKKESRNNLTQIKNISFEGEKENIDEVVKQMKEKKKIYKTYKQEKQGKDFNQLLVFTIFSMIFVCMYLCSYFESFRIGLLAASIIPISAISGILGLSITGLTLNIISLTGLAMLAGITVNSTILLTDSVLRKKAKSTRVKDAVSERIKPLVMTVLTTIMSMLPLALSINGESMQRSMAVVIIGGLLVSTIYVLLVYPFLLKRIVK